MSLIIAYEVFKILSSLHRERERERERENGSNETRGVLRKEKISVLL
jgi:hypothetical protein